MAEENEAIYKLLEKTKSDNDIFICRKCGRLDFRDTLEVLGSKSGCCADCGSERHYEIELFGLLKLIKTLKEHLERLEYSEECEDCSAKTDLPQGSIGCRAKERIKELEGCFDELIFYLEYVEANHEPRTAKEWIDRLRALKGE